MSNCYQRTELAAVLAFIFVSPELKPNRIADFEDKNESRIELRLTELLLIANKKMRIYSSARIAANPMLCVRACQPNSTGKSLPVTPSNLIATVPILKANSMSLPAPKAA